MLSDRSYLDSPSSCSLIVWRSFRWWLVFNFPPKPTKDEVEDVGVDVGGEDDVCLSFTTGVLLRFFHDTQSIYEDSFLLSIKYSSFAFVGDEELEFDDVVLDEGDVGGATPSIYTIFESPLECIICKTLVWIANIWMSQSLDIFIRN